jgi:arsenite methyltransferase
LRLSGLPLRDFIAADRLTPAQRIERGAEMGCSSPAPPAFAGYRDGLARAGFTAISITPTHQIGDGLRSAIIRAARP